MPKVLIPTDEPDILLGLVEGYRSLGWEVATGATNFKIQAAHYDVVHHQWPEEFTGWQVPSQRQIEVVRQHLEWWSSRSICMFSVNNLYPHNEIGHPANHELYSCFYEKCHLITHYSNASRQMVLEEFPASRAARNIVHSSWNYETTLACQRQRGSQRTELGIDEKEFVILGFGQLRTWEEMRLIQRAFGLARIPKKRLLIVGKVALGTSTSGARLRRLYWKLWLKRHRAVVEERYVPEDEMSRFLDSCDVAIVPRIGGLSSGIPSLAMTFGRMVIAPNCGAYPDYLAGTRNLLYETGSPESLAVMLEKAAALDTDDIGRENELIAAKWNWRNICQTCLDAVNDINLSRCRGGPG
jgi:glycosyltransferase involved in cell wall biosynthesis